MRHELFSIGPLLGTNEAEGRTAYFVNPPLPELPVVFGNSLSDAMKIYGQQVPTDTLRVDEILRDEAHDIGLLTAPLSADTVMLMGTIALDLATPDAFLHCDHPNSIQQFMACAAAFETAFPADHVHAGASVDIQFDTEREMFTGLIMAGPGLCVLAGPVPTSQNAGPEAMDGIAVVFAQSQPCVDAVLNRSFGVTGVPEPFVLQSGEKRPLPEAGLERLGAAMQAVSQLQDTSKTQVSATFVGQHKTTTAVVKRT
ncbi:hypothetical protein [Shimia sp.]|uniref:hypothetical protein n=1 Tax=Shimia sp. TaxID=1954381 RepID=UPI003B8C9D39